MIMKEIRDIERYRSNYSDKKLWNKVTTVAKKAGLKVTYAVLLLYYVAKSPNVSITDKAKIYGALGYFILPFDFIPDITPIAGYTDDLAVLIWALNAVWTNITPEMKYRAKQTLHRWFGHFNEACLDSII